jgi:peptidoglycan hydrolase-like protein with peptidoglycan-binding domain
MNRTSLDEIPSGFQFNNNLVLGSTGNDVKYLQIFLNSDLSTAVGNSGNETTYFGNMTRSAVGKFQIKHGLVFGISDAGYGIFGPKTRAKVNSLL